MEDVIDDWVDKFFPDDRIVSLQNFAKEFNFGFDKRNRLGNQPFGVQGFNIFKGKKGKRVRGVIEIEEQDFEGQGRIYDYLYFSEGGKKKTTIIELSRPGAQLPALHIHPKGLISRWKSKFFQNPYATGEEEFDSQFTVESMNPDELTERTIELLISRPGISFECFQDYLIIYYRRKLIEIDRLIAEYEFAVDLFLSFFEETESTSFVEKPWQGHPQNVEAS